MHIMMFESTNFHHVIENNAFASCSFCPDVQWDLYVSKEKRWRTINLCYSSNKFYTSFFVFLGSICWFYTKITLFCNQGFLFAQNSKRNKMSYLNNPTHYVQISQQKVINPSIFLLLLIPSMKVWMWLEERSPVTLPPCFHTLIATVQWLRQNRQTGDRKIQFKALFSSTFWNPTASPWGGAPRWHWIHLPPSRIYRHVWSAP